MMERWEDARTCVVSFVDSGGIRHSIEVAAESLYEAAALAVKEFRRRPWTDGIEPGALTQLQVSIKSPDDHAPYQYQTARKMDHEITQEIMLKACVRALLDPQSDAG